MREKEQSIDEIESAFRYVTQTIGEMFEKGLPGFTFIVMVQNPKNPIGQSFVMSNIREGEVIEAMKSFIQQQGGPLRPLARPCEGDVMETYKPRLSAAIDACLAELERELDGKRYDQLRRDFLELKIVLHQLRMSMDVIDLAEGRKTMVDGKLTDVS